MKPVNNKILVRVNNDQKQSMEIDGVSFSTALNFEKNYREKSPVVAQVIEGNAWVKEGDWLLCHHNTFYLPSPYHLQDDLFAIPASPILFAIINMDGSLSPIYGNLLCDTVEIESDFPLPVDQRKKHLNRAIVVNPGYTPYKEGDMIFHRPSAWYTIVYNLNGVVHRVEKVHEDQICGVVRSKAH